MAADAVVFGEALVDLFPETPGGLLEDVERFLRHPGGAPCNFAIGLQRQGIPTALVTQVGADAFGRFRRSDSLPRAWPPMESLPTRARAPG